MITKIKTYLYSSEEEQEEQEEKIITDPNAFNEKINKEETGMNMEIFKKHFNFQRPSDMFKSLYKANNSQNSKLVSLINSGLKDLKEEIKEITEKERENEKLDKIVKIVREILKSNKQNQNGKGIKILTPNQMLSRLSISLAQLQAGNNSEEFKNEIRQLLYSLCHSKI